jgi:phage-related protein
MTDEDKRVPALFFQTEGGTEPVRDWLKELSKADRKIIGADIKTLEFGWPIGMPLCRSIASRRGLWEIRSSLPDKKIARILFCVHDGSLLLLHGFIKKTQKTPDADLNLADSRMKQVKAAQQKKDKKK